MACKATLPLSLPPPSPAVSARKRADADTVQKFGDTWVAASALGPSDVGNPALRESVQHMFELRPDRSVVSMDPHDEIGLPHSDSTLSFDPNDLNPSRSASQVRRKSTVLGGRTEINAPPPIAEERPSTILEERPSDLSINRLPALTHISHVTFPRPSIKQQPMPSLSSASSTDHTGESSTPASSMTSVSMADPTVIAKLDSHSTEHGTLSKQVDNVQVDLRRIIGSLTALVSQSAFNEKVDSIRLDVQGVETALQLSGLAAGRQTSQDQLHAKIDNIARLCEDVLARSNNADIKPVPEPEAIGLASVQVKATPGEEEDKAGQEVAQIMKVSLLARFR